MLYFVTEMYSTHAREVDNIFVWTIHHWNLCFVVFLKMYSIKFQVDAGFESTLQKCKTVNTRKMDVPLHGAAATSWQPRVAN